MVKIRLKRMGMKKKPFYRVVVADITRGGGARGSLLKRVTAITPLG